jgi:hypothetical protein
MDDIVIVEKLEVVTVIRSVVIKVLHDVYKSLLAQ